MSNLEGPRPARAEELDEVLVLANAVMRKGRQPSFATDYSYRTKRQHQQRLLGGWVKKLSPMLLPEAKAFSLDFHPIPYRGEEAVLDKHYIPCRGKACPSIQSFFAQEHENQVFCYANANLTRDEQSREVICFDASRD